MRILALLALSLTLAVSAAAHEFTAGDLTIEHPWAPPSIAGQSQGAVYFTVKNGGDAPDRLLGAGAAIAEHAELHGHEMDGAVMRMTARDAVDVPAHGTAAFEPGGLHVMLLGLAAPLALEGRFTVTLRFERAGAVDVEVHVESLASHLRRGSGESHDGRAHETGAIPTP